MGKKRDEILTEATKLFSRLGYRSTSMRDIGAACGLLAGSLYAHVGSKEDILFEVTDEGTDSFLAAIDPVAGAEGLASDRLKAMVRTHMELMSEDIPRALVVFHQWKHLSESNRSHITKKRDSYEAYFRDVVQAGVESGEFRKNLNPKIAILTALGALNWVPEWFSHDNELGASEIADQIADLLVHGFAGSPEDAEVT